LHCTCCGTGSSSERASATTDLIDKMRVATAIILMTLYQTAVEKSSYCSMHGYLFFKIAGLSEPKKAKWKLTKMFKKKKKEVMQCDSYKQ